MCDVVTHLIIGITPDHILALYVEEPISESERGRQNSRYGRKVDSGKAFVCVSDRFSQVRRGDARPRPLGVILFGQTRCAGT